MKPMVKNDFCVTMQKGIFSLSQIIQFCRQYYFSCYLDCTVLFGDFFFVQRFVFNMLFDYYFFLLLI